MNDDKQKILERIEKLMAMAGDKSSPEEAAIALKRAEALMQKHQLGAKDVALNRVKEQETEVICKNIRTVPNYILLLVGIIGNVFECRQIWKHTTGGAEKGTTVVFYGFGNDPVLAQYALSVLLRQLIDARESFLSRLGLHLKSSTKTSRANSFAEGWVTEAGKKVDGFRCRLPQDKADLIVDYQKQQYEEQLGTLKTTKHRHSQQAMDMGMLAAKDVQLHHGVGVSAGKGHLLAYSG